MRVLCNIQDSFLWGIVPVFEAVENLQLTVFDDSIPVFDIFDEANPDVFITKNNLLTRAMLKYLQQNRDIKVCVIQTSSRNFYGKELEKDNRIDYTIKDETAADLMTFGGCGQRKETDTNFGQTLVVTDFLSGDAFLRIVNNPSFEYKIVGNKLIEHPSYVGQVDYKEVAYLLNEVQDGLCEQNTDWELALLYNGKAKYIEGLVTNTPHREEIAERYNYNRKLYDILTGLGYDEEANQCLQSLVHH
jgi:hypothetical protein